MKLRTMTMDDADFMLELKNYPETIQYSITTEEEITKQAHYKWLPDNLKYFQVIMDEDKMIGAIRIQDYEVSIWIKKEYWKQGMATWVLQTFCKRGMTAKIVEGNIASMKAFIRAGFLPKSFQNGYYIFQK
jgi:RimJ/RimL family protein N-acetyltransferase